MTDACAIGANQIWLSETRKEEKDRNWSAVLAVLKKAEDAVSVPGLGLLRAAFVSAQISVLSEYVGEVDSAIGLARRSMSWASESRERFLILESMGRQLTYRHRFCEALQWLRDALSETTTAYLYRRVDVLLCASIAIGETDPPAATEYSASAAEKSLLFGLPEKVIVNAHMEHAVSLWLAGDLKGVLLPLTTAVKTLLGCEEDTADWRGLFMHCGHVSGFLCSVALTGRGPEVIADGIEYEQPRRGMFIGDTSIASELVFDNIRVDHLEAKR